MRKFLFLFVAFITIYSCGDTSVDTILDAAQGETSTMQEDTSLVAKVTSWALFKDTLIEETGVIVKVAVDSSFLSSIATLIAGQSLSIDAEGKVGVIKRMSADSVLLLPINLPAEYLDSSLLNNYVKILYNPAKMDVPQDQLKNAKVVALRAVTDYDYRNIDIGSFKD